MGVLHGRGSSIVNNLSCMRVSPFHCFHKVCGSEQKLFREKGFDSEEKGVPCAVG